MYPVHPPPPARFEPSGNLTGGSGGRISRGLDLLGRSWEYLRRYPRLLVLPCLSAVATTIAALLIFAPVLLLTTAWSDRLSMFAAAAASALPFLLISTYFNVGFLGMVTAYRNGEAPTVRDGLRFANRRRRAIASWALLAAIVGTVLSALQQLPVLGEWVGRLIGFLGGLAWALATFFVVPVLVVENVGPVTAIRRSAAVFKARWGEAVTGDLVIGVATGLLSLPFCVLGVAGIVVYPDDMVAGAVLAGVGLAGFVAELALSAALVQFFQLALYEHAVAGSVPAPFTEQDMRGAMTERKPPFWRR